MTTSNDGRSLLLLAMVRDGRPSMVFVDERALEALRRYPVETLPRDDDRDPGDEDDGKA